MTLQRPSAPIGGVGFTRAVVITVLTDSHPIVASKRCFVLKFYPNQTVTLWILSSPIRRSAVRQDGFSLIGCARPSSPWNRTLNWRRVERVECIRDND